MTHLLQIAGQLRPSSDGSTFEVENPATGEAFATVANATVADGKAALDAAVEAGPSWAATDPRERGEILRRAFELTTARTYVLAEQMTAEMGKPVEESRSEIAYGAEFLRWFSEEAVRIAGRWSTAPSGGTSLVTLKQPVGPCLAITPWNFPLAMGTRKIGPALAAGCTMVVKPASLTPLSMLSFGEILTEAGLPPGVVNIVTTTRTGDVMEPLITDPRLRKLTFTGSTEVGRLLMKQSSDRLLRLSMELGGNAPFIVFEDADVDAAVEGALLAKMRNLGEACTSANRFLIHESVMDEFTEKFTAAMSDLPARPLVDATQRSTVAELVADALARGGRVLTGGEVPDGPGWFYPPTVIVDAPADARFWTEEIFGPVAPLRTFSTESEALELANDTEYGLVAYVFTRDLDRARRVFERLETGMVGINQGIVSNPAAPFGGVKASGFGREGGFEGIEEYLSTKYVGLAANTVIA